MKRYYKHYAEAMEGIGVAYLETEDDIVLRQVEVYGDCFFWSDQRTQSDTRHQVCDQPVSILGLTPDDEISAEEFESAWRLAKRASSEGA